MDNSSEYSLEFKKFDVSKVFFERETTEEEYKISINVQQATTDLDKEQQIFHSTFLINAESKNEEKPLSIQIEAGGIFQIHGTPPEDVMENLKFISAPAIAYPYLRTFISNLSLNSGIRPINLPSINFGAVYLQRKEESNNKEKKD